MGLNLNFIQIIRGLNGVPLILWLKRGPAISHEIIQGLLRQLRFDQVLRFQHFALILYHLLDSDRVIFAVVRTVVIDVANILVLIG